MAEYKTGWEGMSLEPWRPEASVGWDEKPRRIKPGRHPMDENPEPMYEEFDPNELWPAKPGVTGEILPLRRNPDGSISLAWPGMIRSMVNQGYGALVGPGEVLTGRTPTGQVSTRSPQIAAQDITSTLMNLYPGNPAPAGSLGMFAGRRAKTANLEKLKAAQSMWDNGYHENDIWKQTGWFKDADQQWKFEIPDSAARLDLSKFEKSERVEDLFHTSRWMFEPKKLGEVLDHPELYAAYPDLAQIPVRSTGMNFGISGAYNPSTNTMMLGGGKAKDIMATTLHETQHGIQEREGFASGGNVQQFLPENFKAEKTFLQNQMDQLHEEAAKNLGRDKNGLEILNKYTTENALEALMKQGPEKMWDFQRKYLEQIPKPVLEKMIDQYAKVSVLRDVERDAAQSYMNLGGEVEARNVEERWASGLGAETPPWETPGYVPREKQIVNLAPGRVGVPVSYDPFSLEKIDFDPFSQQMLSVDHNPFDENPLPYTGYKGEKIYEHKTENVPISWLDKNIPAGNILTKTGEHKSTDEYINALAEDMKKNGLSEPIIITVGKNSRSAMVGEGNHRLAAAKKAGFTSVPVRIMVGQEYGKKFGKNAEKDLIPIAGEYFSADAKPSEVFKSLSTKR